MMPLCLRKAVFLAFLVSALPLSACATRKPPEISYDEPRPAVLQPDPPKPVDVIPLPIPLPLPGQLKPLPGARSTPPEPGDPKTRVDQANAAARMQPTRYGYINAVQVYPFSSGALYQVYTAPGEVTDIALQEGEQLVGSGPVAAGDTVRWIIGDTESGAGPTKRVHILLKPTRPLIALRRQNAAAGIAAPIDTGIDVSKLRFRYRIEGDNPPWRPLSAFDDESKVYIEMPRGLAQGEAPPLFVIGPEGDGQLVNYRVRQNYYIVDRLFAEAELRLGGEHQQVVRIARTDGRVR
jgi:type IV secretion system protein TrbG